MISFHLLEDLPLPGVFCYIQTTMETTRRLFDTHAHVNDPAFEEDREAVLHRAISAGLVGILDVGVDEPTSRHALSLAEKYPFLYAAAGIHPHEAHGMGDGTLAVFRSLWLHPKVRAVGEIGLDYHLALSPRPVQKTVFAQQLAWARQLGKPVIVHVREAMADALSIVDATAPPPWLGVFHCFGGDEKNVHAVLDRGFHISFTGVVSFRNFRRLDVVRAVPIDRLLLETDAPYMAPIPFRGKRNEPAYLVEIVQALAAIRGETPEEVAEATTQNALRLFGIEG